MAQRFFKQSAALEDYDFDWSGWLVDGDFITNFTVTADDGVKLGDVSHQQGSPIIKQFVSGGTHGNSYKVTCQIQTDQGRSDVAQVIILIRDIGTGGQPIAPPLEEEDEMTIIFDMSAQAVFPQKGIVYHPEIGDARITLMKTGQLVTIIWDFVVDLPVGLDHVELLLPFGFQGKPDVDFAGNYIYNLPPAPAPVPPVPGLNIPGTAYIQGLTGSDRVAFYPKDYGVFAPSNDYYIAGQMTYTTQP